MHLRIYDPRIIAIDLRFRRSGFAIFEGPKRLLDFGSTPVQPGQLVNAGNSISELLKLSLPTVIVIKKQRWEKMLIHPQANLMIEALTSESGSHRIQIRLLDQEAIRSTYRNLGCETKGEISSALVRMFPELDWHSPPIRRAWEPEHSAQMVFDAIALGLAYWQNETNIADAREKTEFQE